MVGAAFSMVVLTYSLSVVMGCFLKRELPFGGVDHKQKACGMVISSYLVSVSVIKIAHQLYQSSKSLNVLCPSVLAPDVLIFVLSTLVF